MATYTTLAIVDDVNTCDCCGKSNLKSTVAMERDDGEVLYFGSVCATSHSGRAGKVIRSEAQAAYDSKVEAAKAEFNASEEYAAERAKLAEANAARIQPGRTFAAYVSAACDMAHAKRKEIAAKYSLHVYAI